MLNEPQFVDKRVTQTKFNKQVSNFERHSSSYRKEGIICLRIEFPFFEFALFGKKGHFQFNLPPFNVNGNVILAEPLSVTTNAPFLLFAIRVDYSNFDALPPSLRIIDPITSDLTRVVGFQPIITPAQQDESNLVHHQFRVQNQSLLLEDNRGRLFICLRGLREYHSHPDHSGDPWLLYRNSGKGDILHVLDQLQLYAISNYNKLLEQQPPIPFDNAGLH